MNELFLHHVWQYQLFAKQNLTSSQGAKIEILHCGEHNTNAGPDFLNARIKFDNIIWVGNVEIHLKASDWHAHKHADNLAYNNLILQVVLENDCPCVLENGKTLETFVPQIPENILANYQWLVAQTNSIACKASLKHIDNFFINHWLSRLTIERLDEKAQEIETLLEKTKNSWEESFYIHLAGSFGLKINVLPFEMLARSLPVNILAKHKNSLFQLEALLFGQAGFLSVNNRNCLFYQKLQTEYNFLSKKYNLAPLEVHLWKHLRLRPTSFPEIRIAQFAQLIFQSKSLFSQLINCTEIKKLKQAFGILPKVQMSRYCAGILITKKEKQNG